MELEKNISNVGLLCIYVYDIATTPMFLIQKDLNT